MSELSDRIPGKANVVGLSVTARILAVVRPTTCVQILALAWEFRMSRRLACLALLGFVLVLPLAACSAATPKPSPTPTVNAWDACPRWASQARSVSFGGDGAHNLLVCNWMPVAKKLADRGYRVLAFDFNGFGVSETTTTGAEGDVVAAAAFLRSDGATSIVLMGASMGGTAVVAAGVEITPPVAGVVDLSGPMSFGTVDMNGSDAAPRLAVPVLYVASDGDGTAPDAAKSLYDATAPALRTLAIVAGADHGIALLIDGGSLQGWESVNTFLTEHAPV